MKTINIQKGHILQYKGDLKPKVYTVESGLIRSYSIDKKGKEHIFMFAPEGWIISDAAHMDGACELFIDAIEDSSINIIEREDRIPHINARAILKRISVLQKRVIMLMSSSAMERYEDFVETYPDIIQRVPQKMIASYLGITPEALSRVRKKISLRK